MRRALATFGLVALLAGASAAWAAEAIPEMAKDIRGRVIGNMTIFTCGTEACTPATAEELANPPVSLERAESIVMRGISTAVAEHCGLDWQERSFLPMMAYWRHERKLPVRQLAMIAGIHGVTQGTMQGALKGRGGCTDALRATAEAQADFRPEDMK
jgi:hypothetical protein